MAQTRHIAASFSFFAALSMAASPIAAADLPAPLAKGAIASHGVFDADSENVQRHRYYRYRHHRHGIDGGDVLAGVLILGGIAAIASAASNNDRNRRYRDREYREQDNRNRDYDYRDRREDSRYDGARGIDRAVDLCVSRIERDVRVESVDSVDRTGEGWNVSGSLYNGEGFTCRIGPDGRIDDIDYDSIAASNSGQLSDERYRAAWQGVDSGKIVTPQDTSGVPAYPGGPIDGDLAEEGSADDGRYTAAD